MPAAHMTAQEFRELFDAVSNWGRWDDDGRRGALNHLTPARIAAAVRLVHSGTTVTLSLPLQTEARIDVPEPADHHMTMLTDVDIGSGSVRFAKDYVGLDYHNEGHSHIDAFCHVAFDGLFFDGKPERVGHGRGRARRARSTSSRTGWSARPCCSTSRACAESLGRAGRARFPRGPRGGRARPGREVGAGDILLVRTGHTRRLAELDPWDTRKAKAGLHPTAASFLAERQVAALGSDGNNDTVPSTTEGVAFPIHVLASTRWASTCSTTSSSRTSCRTARPSGRWEFLFVAAPLRIVRGTGSPLNPIAIF